MLIHVPRNTTRREERGSQGFLNLHPYRALPRLLLPLLNSPPPPSASFFCSEALLCSSSYARPLIQFLLEKCKTCSTAVKLECLRVMGRLFEVHSPAVGASGLLEPLWECLRREVRTPRTLPTPSACALGGSRELTRFTLFS